MISPGAGVRAYVSAQATDMRKSIDGLAALVVSVFRADPLCGQLFVFISRRRDRVKILYWDRHGFALWYKRLEDARFHWPRQWPDAVIELREEQLHWLLAGYDITRMRPHETVHYSRVL